MIISELKEKLNSFFDASVIVEQSGDPVNMCDIVFPFKDRKGENIRVSVQYDPAGEYLISDSCELITDVLIEALPENQHLVKHMIGLVYTRYGLNVDDMGIANMLIDELALLDGLIEFLQALIAIDHIGYMF